MTRSTAMSRAAAALIAFCGSGAALASPVAALTYSMPNGEGKAIGGAYNYWDGAYDGSGAKTVDGAALMGGLGKLTDGVVATQAWNKVSNSAGTGQDVGWFPTVTPNPKITFTFAAGTVIDEVDIDLDNSGTGAVFAPSAILIDGISEAFTAPVLGTVGEVAIRGVDLVGTSHTIQFDQAGPNDWVMVSEIAFLSPVPEPDVMALLGLGFAIAVRVRHGQSGTSRPRSRGRPVDGRQDKDGMRIQANTSDT